MQKSTVPNPENYGHSQTKISLYLLHCLVFFSGGTGVHDSSDICQCFLHSDQSNIGSCQAMQLDIFIKESKITNKQGSIQMIT